MSGGTRLVALLVAACVFGLSIAWIDSSPGWDDTGITVGMILIVSALFGALSPGRAWLWALGVGIWIPGLNIMRQHNYASLIAIGFAILGSYAGAYLRKLTLRTNHS